jgi:stage V sporulation protein SpoVS
LEEDGIVEAHAIGAGAVNQAVKAIAIARRLVEREGEAEIKVTPGSSMWRSAERSKRASAS